MNLEFFICFPAGALFAFSICLLSTKEGRDKLKKLITADVEGMVKKDDAGPNR